MLASFVLLTIFSVDGEPSGVTEKYPIRKNTLIAGIVRGRTPIIPGGNDVILPDDRVVVISSEHRLNELTDILK